MYNLYAFIKNFNRNTKMLLKDGNVYLWQYGRYIVVAVAVAVKRNLNLNTCNDNNLL